MSKSKIKKPFKPNKTSEQTILDSPNSQEKAAMTALLNDGRITELEALLKTWTKRFPNYVLGWQALAALLNQQKRSATELLPLRQKIVELLPEDAEVHLYLGTTLRDLGQLDDATVIYRLAIKIKPNSVEAHCNLGITLCDLGQLNEAEVICRRALEINPNFAEAHSNLGVTLHAMGRLNEAEVCYKRTLEIKPDSAETLNNLGYLLHDLGRQDEAEASFREALRVNPNYAPAYNNLGCFLQNRGQLDDAVALFRQLLQIQPDNVTVHSSLIFDLDLMMGQDAASLLEERLRWDVAHAAHLHQHQTHTNVTDPEHRICIGYVSADFHNHSAPKVFGGMLTCYDRSQFDVYVYSNFKGKSDEITELFKQNVTTWRDIAGLSDDAVAKIITEDQIDILVDLSGHSAGNRLLVFARKPAPIQITAWGYATGTGMRAMDVFFTDPVMVPPEDKQYFTEQVRYLPSVVGAFFFEPFPDVNELPALSDGIITFGSFNRMAKMSDKVYRTWAEVLLAVPRSRLILKTAELDDAKISERIIGYFTNAGVTTDRITLLGKTSWHEHMQAYQQIDIALDPFPHGGGVTALEGLMMGVPIITLNWPTVAGKLSASIMTTMGLPDWIAKNQEHYVELATQKAHDFKSLALLRRQLRGIFTTSILGDQAAYARAVEQEYRQLWQEWCSSVKKPTPQHLDAPATQQIEQNTKVPPSVQKPTTKKPPKDAETHFQLGNTLLERGQPDAAVGHYRRALEFKQDCAEVYCNLGNALSKLGQLDDAMLNYQRALQISPDNAETYFNLAIILKITGRPDEAETTYRRALEIKPNFPEAHNNLAYTLRDMGRPDEAETSCRRALEFKPDFAPAHYNLGIILSDLGRLDEAEASCRRALENKQNFAEAYCSLGSILRDQHRLDEAIICYQTALNIKPDYADAHSNLGVGLRDLGQLNESEASCRRALEINPDSAGAFSNLGATLRDLGQLNEAEACCRRALEINPNFAPAHYNLGVTINSLGWLEEAETHYRRALEIKPDFTDAHSNLIFTLDLMPDKDIACLQEERLRWDLAHAAHLHQQQAHANIPDPERRIRIGYVSADFHNHSATRVFGSMLIRYDRSQFDVFAYSNSKGQDDELTELFRQNVTAWRNIVSLSDDAVAKMIREDQIDILVDLSGHTAGNRLLVFARKPAPIQITAWGYATGTGMRAMDVFFTDPVMVPPEDKQYFTEQVRYLPSVVGAFFFEPFPDANKLPALSDGIITFGSFNRLAKVSDKSYRAWAEVLLAVPRSRLILKTAELNDATVRERVIEHFTQAGVAADRITLQGKTSWHEHMQAYQQIDIALDPFPHGGGVTALEGLMMGVPVITLCWPTMAGRLSASIMITMGLPDWIATTPEHYVELAIQKASDLQSLALLRRQLRGIFTSSVLGDQAAYALAVEHEYRQLWIEWCSSTENFSPQQMTNLIIEQDTKALPPVQKVAMEQPPEDAETHFQLGNTLLERGQTDAAVTHYRQALELKQDYAEVYCNLGNALSKLGQLDEAMLSYQRALQFQPDNAVTHFNLAIILKETGRLDQAETSYRRALEIKEAFPEAHNNLAYTLKDMGRLDEAEAGFRRALQLKPDYAEAHYNLGLTLYNLGRLNEVEACYRRALQLNPDYPEAYNNLGNVLQDVEQIDAAQTSYRRALEIKPDFAEAHSNLIFSQDLTDTVNLPELHRERKKWEETHAAPLWQDAIHTNNCSPSRRLRIGYVSADFRKHSAPKVFGSMLTRYDRSQFDVFAYSNSKCKSDEHTELFRQNVTVWRDIVSLSDDAAAKMIREDQIDILVDLSGHTAGNRLLVFARKPAPIQITAWGYATGTGMRAMDVFF
ncbi:MAG TPA: tetratricopeptide repeat protein, partial [Methylobacter sp.]